MQYSRVIKDDKKGVYYIYPDNLRLTEFSSESQDDKLITSCKYKLDVGEIDPSLPRASTKPLVIKQPKVTFDKPQNEFLSSFTHVSTGYLSGELYFTIHSGYFDTFKTEMLTPQYLNCKYQGFSQDVFSQRIVTTCKFTDSFFERVKNEKEILSQFEFIRIYIKNNSADISFIEDLIQELFKSKNATFFDQNDQRFRIAFSNIAPITCLVKKLISSSESVKGDSSNIYINAEYDD